MSRERELLEKIVAWWDDDKEFIGDFVEEIRAYLSIPEPTQDEPVDISAKSGPTIVAMLPNGVAVSNVYEAYEAGLKEGSLQDEEPFVYVTYKEVLAINAMKTNNFADSWKSNLGFVKEEGDVGLYLHPAPRLEFVRLSEEEVTEILTSAYDMYAAICAVENRLVEKNK